VTTITRCLGCHLIVNSVVNLNSPSSHSCYLGQWQSFFSAMPMGPWTTLHIVCYVSVLHWCAKYQIKQYEICTNPSCLQPMFGQDMTQLIYRHFTWKPGYINGLEHSIIDSLTHFLSRLSIIYKAS